MHTRDRFTLSFEVFPPQREGSLDSLFETINELVQLDPHFISVTYGAGGGTRDTTIEIASRIKNDVGTEALAHLTCVQATRDDIARVIDKFKDENIENILALRGDPPKDHATFVRPEGGFGFANELVEFIREKDEFCIGVAGYPEGHVEAPTLDDDLKNLKRKVDAGADFIITQLFFDNDDFYRFRDRAIAMDITVPIIPGIFALFNFKQIARIGALCDPNIPKNILETLDRVKDKSEEVEKYGIEFAITQAEHLLENDVSGLHFYSMNRSTHVLQIVRELSLPAKKRTLPSE